ncbi:class I SAM-dependent methyltransferase [bacterium]|nr:class I SAM-dependent methyltransferase [bacterium]MBU1435526.1 class I SAM-dependent methyltransferase [bacterium]MBU1502550.1 class I SAM-dependent methyltransferase [bacterium]
MKQNCPLCSHEATLFYQNTDNYFQCKECHSLFVDTNARPNIKQEKERYELHSDDVEDKGYQNFVSPMTSAIMQDYSKQSRGLDFGAGIGPIISKVVQDRGYNIKQYDPFFHNYPELLKEKYDYVASCEVVEHFYHPHKEFGLLKSLLDEDAKLYIMTDLYDESIDFAKWYYKNDSTHVFFYTKESFGWIQKEFGFKSLQIEKRLVTLS